MKQKIDLFFVFFVLVCEAQIDYSCVHSSAWKLNKNGNTNSLYSATTDVSSSAMSSNDLTWSVTATRIPDYTHPFTSGEILTLNTRPKASTDFTSGKTTAVAGGISTFGANIGYKTSPPGCSQGYWPPESVCPVKASLSLTWNLQPAAETRTDGCFTPVLGVIGYWVNGVSVFGASDGQSYKSASVWHNSAPEFEVYDLDVCNGHAANGNYHHHHFPRCLQLALGDTGNAHSPVYGWALDSFPIYGPFQSNAVYATSCWLPRDYQATSGTGCSDSTRSCTLLNPEDVSQGVVSVPVGSAGPSLTGTVTTQSGNVIAASSGVFVEDYYFSPSCAAQGGKYLDSHNGHSHGDLGYHYHVTTNAEGEGLYPYMAGPKFYGCVSNGACCASQFSGNCNSASTCGKSQGTSSHGCLVAQTSPTGVPTFAPSNPTDAPTLMPSARSSPPTLAPTVSDKSLTEYSTAVIIGVVVGVGGSAIMVAISFFVYANCHPVAAGSQFPNETVEAVATAVATLDPEQGIELVVAAKYPEQTL